MKRRVVAALSALAALALILAITFGLAGIWSDNSALKGKLGFTALACLLLAFFSAMFTAAAVDCMEDR